MLNNDGADQSGSRREAMERPAALLPGRALDPDDPGGFPRRERNVEAIERMGKAVAKRLDERFFPRPAIEESQRLVPGVEGKVSLVLVAGERTCRDIIGVGDRANDFDVDPDLASACKGVHRDIFRVRYVEAQVRVRGMACERRFAVRAVCQLYRFRLDAELSLKNVSGSSAKLSPMR